MTLTTDETKQLLVTSDNSVYDFEVTHTPDGKIEEATLKRSKCDKGWNNAGTTALKLTDNGNEVIVKLEDKKPIKFQYHELCELFIVLSEYMEADKKNMRTLYERFVKSDGTQYD